MPARNGTGPTGKGARTGRGLGSCNSEYTHKTPNANIGGGQGLGLRRGFWGAAFGRLFGRRRSNQNKP